MRDRIKLMFGLFGLVCIAALCTDFADYLKKKRAEQLREQAEREAEIVGYLELQCRAAWPLLETNYDECLTKVKRMYRRDI